MQKTYIWPKITRISHILLIVTLFLAYVISDEKSVLNFHVALGVGLGILFLFRVIWGLIGPKYSKFSDFTFNINELKEYTLNVFGKKKEYLGHNPASSWAVIAMIVLAFISVITGFLAYGIQDNKGIFASLSTPFLKSTGIFGDIHSFFVNLLVFVVFVHIAGVIIDKVFHKGDALESMIDGYKKGKEKNIKLNIIQKVFSVIWIFFPIFSIVYILSVPNNIFIKKANLKSSYTKKTSRLVNIRGKKVLSKDFSLYKIKV
jgi:cytochrome b